MQRHINAQAMIRMSKVVRDRMTIHRQTIQQPVLDLTTKCIDMILSHPEIVRPEWDTDEEKKAIINDVKASVYKVIIEWLDKEIGSNVINGE